MTDFFTDHPRLEAVFVATGIKRKRLWREIADYRRAQIPVVHAYREALANDGWEITASYNHEPVKHAWRAKRAGFTITGLARPIYKKTGSVHKPEIHGWGPDGAVIAVPQTYSFTAVQSATRVCDQCGATDVDTARYGFSNRCCATCGPEFIRKLSPSRAD